MHTASRVHNGRPYAVCIEFRYVCTRPAVCIALVLLLLSLIYRSRGCYLLSEIKLYTNIGARWSKYCECYELKIKPERCQRKTISFRHDDLTLITPHRQTKQQSAAKTIE